MPKYRVTWTEQVERDVLASDKVEAVEFARQDCFVDRRKVKTLCEPTVRNIDPKKFRVARTEVYYYDVYAIDKEDAVEIVTQGFTESEACHQGKREIAWVEEGWREELRDA